MQHQHLIKEIKKHPCLWNKSLREYGVHSARDDAWDKISAELERPVEGMKLDWKILKDCYKQAIQRRKRKTADKGKKMRPWKYEDLMSFLQSEFSASKSQLDVDVAEHCQNEESSEQMDGDNQNEESSEQMDGDNQNEKSSEQIDGDNQNEEEGEQTGSEVSASVERRTKRQRIDFNRFQIGNKVGNADKLQTFRHEINKDKKLGGELDFFFASVRESTKRLPRHLQLKVKAEVMNVVLSAEMKC